METNGRTSRLLRLDRKLEEAIRANDGEAAHFLLDRAIRDGVATAFAQKANLYESGCGSVPADMQEAVKWYQRSVEALDDIYSHQGLARIYLQFSEFDPNRSLARYHLDVLAGSGDMGGLYGLGLLYQLGIGVAVDLDRALELHVAAADKGHIAARLSIRQIRLQKAFSWRHCFWGLVYALKRKVILLRNPADPRVGIG